MSSGSGGWDFGSGQGYQPSQGPAERLGLTRIGPYEILGEVARGGMGVVYRGRDSRLGRPVAIKLLLAPGTQSQDAPRVRRFTREAEALASLSHPGLLAVYDFGVLPQPVVPFMVTEWLEGQTLDERMRQEGTFRIPEALDLAETIARALGHAHERGILHRDLKPSNVVLAPRGPVVIDFGLAKRQDLAQSRLTQTGAMAGTTGFAAPEQLRDAAAVDERADVYGLGATLYALLTGFPPGGHEGRGLEVFAANATGKFPLPSELRPEVPRAVDRLVAKALALEPDQRMGDAEEFAEAIAGLGSARERDPLRPLKTVGAVLLLVGLGLGLGKAILTLRGPGRARGGPPSPTATQTLTPSPAPSPSTGVESPSPTTRAELQELTRALVEVERAIVEAPVEAAPLGASYAQGHRLAAQILAGATSPQERWPAIRHLVLAGRTAEAEPLLRDLGRAPGFVARANLELACLALTRPGFLGLRPVIRRAAERALGPGLDPDEDFAARLARVLQRVLTLGSDRSRASAVQIELSSILRDPKPDAWRMRVVWTTCAYAALLAPPKFRRLISEAWGPARLEKLQLPRFSTISAWHLGLASGTEPGVVEELGAFFAAHRSRIASPELQACLAAGYAAAGSLGGVERSLRFETGLGAEARAQLRRQARAVASTRGGSLGGELSAPPLSRTGRVPVEWLTLSFEPSEQTLGVWLVLPEDAERWGVRLAGAEVDFDLRLRRDGPPRHASLWEGTALTMARGERLEGKGGGCYFLQVERATPWPVPVEVTLELHTPSHGRLSLGRDPWELETPTTEVPGLRQAFSASRSAFKAGQVEESLRVLAPFLERSSQARLVHWSLLDFAARWEDLAQTTATSRDNAGPRGQLAAWLFARSRAALRQHASAREAMSSLTQRAPEVLEAWLSLISLEAAAAGVPGGRKVWNEARRRFPEAPVLELMGLALGEDAGALGREFRRLQTHSEARRHAVALLFFLEREQLALSLLESMPAGLRALPRSVLFRAYALGRAGRVAQARALLDSVESGQLSPQLAGQFERAREALRAR